MTDRNAEPVKQIANAMNFDDLETLMPQNRDGHNTNCITYKRSRPAGRTAQRASTLQGRSKMIVDAEDHRIAYRADHESSMNHTLVISLELLLLLLCVGVHSRWSWRHGPSGSFTLASLGTIGV